MNATRLFDRLIIRLAPRSETENVADFLQGLVTNDVSGALPAYAALLSAQGKCMFDFLVWRDGDDVLLDCETAIAPDLVKRLSLYRLRRLIDIAVDETLGVHWRAEGEQGQPDPRLADLGRRWLAPASSTDESADDDWREHRLSLGVPEGAGELGDILWLETNAVELNGVSFEKGCYIGQENTARMNWRQKVNRRLVVVPLSGSDDKRQVAAYPALNMAVDHLRTDAIDVSQLPEWQRSALSAPDNPS